MKTLAFALLAVVGCSAGPDCIFVDDHPASTADFTGVGVPSKTAHTNEDPAFHVTAITTSIAFATDADSDHCLRVQFASESSGYGIGMHCPSGPGTFELEDLGAKVCEATAGVGGGGCAPVKGSIVVRAITLKCSNAACGVLDADLDVAGPSSAPTVSGTAHLGFTQTMRTAKCPTYPFPE